MIKRSVVSSYSLVLLAACGIASAQNAYTAKPMNVRAGPNRDYPLVAQVDEGTPLDVHGCLDSWSWCDVSFEGNRGWMYAGGISFVYNGQRVPIYSYGPQLGLPIITFSLGTYWGQYYRGRPWYGQRDTWEHRHFPPHAPIRRSRGGPPPMSHGRPAAGGHPGGRTEERGPSEERGRSAPAAESARMGHAPQHMPAPRQKGPTPSRGKPEHGGHGNQDRHDKRPP